MLLNEYPATMTQIERDLLQTEQRIRSVQDALSTQSAFADREVAFDDSLKNDTQRKARRADLLRCNADYQKTLIVYQELCERLRRACASP